MMMMMMLLLLLLLLLLLPETLCPRLGSSACSLNVPRLGAFSIKCMRVCAFMRACVRTSTLAGMGVGKAPRTPVSLFSSSRQPLTHAIQATHILLPRAPTFR